MLLAWDGAYKNTRRVGSAGTAVALAAAFLVAGAGVALHARLAGVCGRLSAGAEASCANARARDRNVGSLWAGGVGKTPVTIAVARLLQEAGVRVAVLTHGYGGSRYRMGALVDPAQCPDPAAVGDEAAELRLALPDVPIAVGKWRVRMAQAAMARWSPDALVLDDGFQHLPLARTLDLVLLPAESPLGNGYCLPAGPLRETPDGLQRASGVVWVYFGSPHPQPLSHARWERGVGAHGGAPYRSPSPASRERGTQGVRVLESPTYTANVAPTALLRLATGERLPLDALQERPLTLVCGVARPQRFLHSVDALGYMVAETHTFPDHHAYTPDDMRMLAGRTVLTTLKDAVKLKWAAPRRLRRLRAAD
jgi:tetraacyldisaccharide-1-P 4'-kinase